MVTSLSLLARDLASTLLSLLDLLLLSRGKLHSRPEMGP